MGNGKSYYEILGVKQCATISEIKKAYKELSKKYHPDFNKEKDSVEKFAIIVEAISILSDTFKKEKYDISLRSGTASLIYPSRESLVGNGYYRRSDSVDEVRRLVFGDTEKTSYRDEFSSEFAKNIILKYLSNGIRKNRLKPKFSDIEILSTFNMSREDFMNYQFKTYTGDYEIALKFFNECKNLNELDRKNLLSKFDEFLKIRITNIYLFLSSLEKLFYKKLREGFLFEDDIKGLIANCNDIIQCSIDIINSIELLSNNKEYLPKTESVKKEILVVINNYRKDVRKYKFLLDEQNQKMLGQEQECVKKNKIGIKKRSKENSPSRIRKVIFASVGALGMSSVFLFTYGEISENTMENLKALFNNEAFYSSFSDIRTFIASIATSLAGVSGYMLEDARSDKVKKK